MDQKRKDNLLTQLMTGQLHFQIDNRPYFLSVPTVECRIIAQTIYEEELFKNRFQKWLNAATARSILISRGIIAPNIDQQVKALEERLEDLKVNLYKSMFSTSDEKKIKKDIVLVKNRLGELEKQKNEIFHLTLEGFASRLKFTTLVAASIYSSLTGRRVYDDEEIKTPDLNFVDIVTARRAMLEPNTEEIREVARSYPWRNTWSLGKPNPFGKVVLDLTEHQQSLMIYSNMYDNIRESSDCPSNTVINDDDMCDGWLILQNRKREKDLREKQTEDILGKNSKAQEIGIPVKSLEDRKRVMSMNDQGTKIVLQQRQKQIEKAGVIKDGDLMDNRIKKQAIAIQQFKERAG